MKRWETSYYTGEVWETSITRVKSERLVITQVKRWETSYYTGEVWETSYYTGEVWTDKHRLNRMFAWFIINKYQHPSYHLATSRISQLLGNTLATTQNTAVYNLQTSRQGKQTNQKFDQVTTYYTSSQDTDFQ